MRAVVAATRRFFPEALVYVDEHFGRKLRAPHAVMAREMAALARTKHLAHDAIDAPRRGSVDVGLFANPEGDGSKSRPRRPLGGPIYRTCPTNADKVGEHDSCLGGAMPDLT